MGHRAVLQMDKAEHCNENLVGVFRECSPNPSLGCSHRLSTCCKNKGLQQKPIHHYGSGNTDKSFCFGENSPQIFNH